MSYIKEIDISNNNGSIDFSEVVSDGDAMIADTTEYGYIFASNEVATKLS
jgi:SepF-like predicted cell division protein (DUF552 family)